jgi:hypothetical protein
MASFCAPLASSSSAMAEYVMAADVITSAAPSISIRILFSFFADDLVGSLDGPRQLANHNSFD